MILAQAPAYAQTHFMFLFGLYCIACQFAILKLYSYYCMWNNRNTMLFVELKLISKKGGLIYKEFDKECLIKIYRMKNKITSIAILLILSLFASCSKGGEFFQNTQKSEQKIPFIPLEGNLLQVNELRSSSDSPLDNLGMGYNPFTYPFVSTRNTTYLVMDVEKIYSNEKFKNTIRIKNINEMNLFRDLILLQHSKSIPRKSKKP